MLLTISSAFSIKFTPQDPILFSHFSPAYITNRDIYLCYYLDLNCYYTEICTEEILNLCQHSHNQDICDISAAHLNKQLNKIGHDLDPIVKRAKREFYPLRFVGKINHSMTGTMDANQYQQYVNKIKNNTEVIHAWANSETLLVKQTLEINKNSFDKLKENLISLQNRIKKNNNEVEQAMNNILTTARIQEITNLATLLIIEHKKIANSLTSIIQDALTGRLIT